MESLKDKLLFVHDKGAHYYTRPFLASELVRVADDHAIGFAQWAFSEGFEFKYDKWWNGLLEVSRAELLEIYKSLNA